MSDRPEPGSGSGLLSKMVKFVKNPTTQWSDLDRSQPTLSDAQARQDLKELMERKRRNDFVRNREFDMLRKLRRKEALTDEDRQAASFYISGQHVNTGERERTLKKIDEIEAQMSRVWLQRRGPQAAAPAPGAGAPPPAAHPAAPVLNEPPPLQPVAVRAFAPTEPMERAQRRRPDAESPPPQRPAAAAPAAPVAPEPPMLAPEPAPELEPPPAFAPEIKAVAPMRGVGFGLSDFQVEVVAGTTKLDPAIEEAAIRYANGDVAGAEAGLRDLIGNDGMRQDDVDAWMTLFDLYRATGQQEKFDDTALHFASRFGRSPPQWGAGAGADSRAVPMAQAAASPGNVRFHWVCPSTLNMQSLAAINAMMTRHASPWRIDWRYVKAIDREALPGLLQIFQRWAGEPVRLKFFEVERLLQALAEKSPAEDREADPMWWQVRLALLRALGEMEEFELAALNYCVTYEVSPPAWEDPKNGYSPMTEEGQTIISMTDTEDESLPPTPTTQPSSGFGATDLMADTAPRQDANAVRPDLTGNLLGSAASILTLPGVAPPAKPVIEFNCRHLLRVDFAAAGDLLNWAIDRKTEGKQVSFKQVNRIVAAFFGVIGITDAARVVLRVD